MFRYLTLRKNAYTYANVTCAYIEFYHANIENYTLYCESKRI